MWRKVSKQINSSSRFSQWLKHCGACMNCLEFCSALLHFSFLSASLSSHTSLTLTLAILKLPQLSLVAAVVAFRFIWFLFCLLCCMALFSFFCLVSLVLFMCMYFIIVCALREHKASSNSSGSGRKTPANRSSDTRVFSIRIRRGRSSRLSLGKYKFLSRAHTVSPTSWGNCSLLN